jgi:hypothetical protein
VSNEQLTILAAAIGIASLMAGLLIRAGRLRWWLRTYWDAALPAAQRAGGLVLLPMGVLFLVGVLGVVLEWKGLSPFGMSLAFAALVTFIVVMPFIWSRPPAWLKPRWLRDQEVRARADPAFRAELIRSHERRFSRREYRAAWSILIALGVASLLLGWPPVVLLGLGIAGATVYARRPRDGKAEA